MSAIILEDESLRDGLQFEKSIVSLNNKLKIFQKLVDAGVKRIQVGSFVHPKIVPQLADTDEFVIRVKDTKGVIVSGLVLNSKGLERAKSCGLKHISLSSSISDTHSLKNVKRSSDDALFAVTQMIGEALASGIAVRAGVQCAFGCVYEGAMSEAKVIDAIGKMKEAGASEFNLADTTGMAHPLQIKNVILKVVESFPEATLSLHLHDTRGLAIANMMAGYEAGVRSFDTSAGGLGGCPFVKGAAGNIATEDAVNLFDSYGEATGISLGKMCEVAELYEEILGRTLPGKMSSVLRTIKKTIGNQ